MVFLNLIIKGGLLWLLCFISSFRMYIFLVHRGSHPQFERDFFDQNSLMCTRTYKDILSKKTFTLSISPTKVCVCVAMYVHRLLGGISINNFFYEKIALLLSYYVIFFRR